MLKSQDLHQVRQNGNTTHLRLSLPARRPDNDSAFPRQGYPPSAHRYPRGRGCLKGDLCLRAAVIAPMGHAASSRKHIVSSRDNHHSELKSSHPVVPEEPLQRAVAKQVAARTERFAPLFDSRIGCFSKKLLDQNRLRLDPAGSPLTSERARAAGVALMALPVSGRPSRRRRQTAQAFRDGLLLPLRQPAPEPAGQPAKYSTCPLAAKPARQCESQSGGLGYPSDSLSSASALRLARAMSTPSATFSNIACPQTRSRTRPLRLRGVVCPAFTRRIPRTPISTSGRVISASLRAATTVRGSCAGSDSQFTDRSPPGRISCTMRRGILTIRLHGYCLEAIANVPRLQQLYRKSHVSHRRAKPLRESLLLGRCVPSRASISRTKQGLQPVRCPSWLPRGSGRSHQQRKCSSFPKNRRFQHSATRSFLEEVGAGNSWLRSLTHYSV
jgi:hypothetical protein